MPMIQWIRIRIDGFGSSVCWLRLLGLCRLGLWVLWGCWLWVVVVVGEVRGMVWCWLRRKVRYRAFRVRLLRLSVDCSLGIETGLYSRCFVVLLFCCLDDYEAQVMGYNEQM